MTTPSPASQRLGAYYARVQTDLLGMGLLRRDGGGTDTPYTARQLADTFVRTAGFSEFSVANTPNGATGGSKTGAEISRWTGPVKLTVTFSNSVARDTRLRDTAQINRLTRRLARLTQHPVAAQPNGTKADGNFRVFVLDTDDLGDFSDPSVSKSVTRQIALMSRDTPCVVFTFSDGGAITSALAVIRAEQPSLMRDACYHEEIAQGLGLTNDTNARPSVFNDNNEFALLTDMDENMLRMLYDARMPLGSDAVRTKQIANMLAAALLEPTS